MACALSFLLLLLLPLAPAQAEPLLVVHEWGTFTSLQNEQGRAIGGINTDDEAVPEFVHTVGWQLLLWPTELPPSLVKGIPRLHPDVTLRLETPVMYFYPPAGSPVPLEVDVQARFRGGWLTEYYPQAIAETPGLIHKLENGNGVLGGIGPRTTGTLHWQGLRVGGDAPGPRTDAEVWLAPRRVAAASVSTPEGESEKYLFYRGVGHLESLLSVRRADPDWLEIHCPEAAFAGLELRGAWLVQIRPEGSLAFRDLGALYLDEGALARVPATFDEEAFAAENLGALRASMHQALTGDGLFADEAQAMLDTWEAAYFQTPGLRLFFTVPQEWTDHYLPLEFSRPVELTRVMVGRIEIVTPQQRDLLARIAAQPNLPFPAGELSEMYRADSDLYRHLTRGETKVTELGLSLPESYLAYLELGRMRNALILEELALRPTQYLRAFISQYQLSGHPVPDPEPGEALPVPEAAGTAVREEQPAALPLSLTLAQNHPNPFNSQTLIQYGLPQAAPVELRVYSLAGQLVARLAQGYRPAGEYTVYWDGRDAAGRPLGTGVYIYRLAWGQQTLSRKLLLLR
jgi:hypothetical protein